MSELTGRTLLVLALLSMLRLNSNAGERRIEIPLDPSGGLPIAEVVSGLAQAAGVDIARPAVALTLPTRGLAGSLSRTLLGECLGSEVRVGFRSGAVVLAVDEADFAAEHRDAWKRRLEDLAERSLQASRRQGYYGMRALPSYRPNDPARPTVCLVHGINSSSGGYVHVIPLLEQAGYGIVVYDYPFNQRLEASCAQFRRDIAAFRNEAGETRPWAILAHSMGALVARSYVEQAGRTDHDVTSLILIGPVNQGAHIARIQPLYQTLSSMFAINSKRTSQALALLSEDIGLAADDLLPGSPFLKRLNDGARAPGVRYHILAGDSGIITADVRRQAQTHLDTAARDAGIVGFFSRIANREVSALLDELTDGTGDGCVAVDRTRLPDVSDHIIMHANHAELIRAPMFYEDDGPVPCMPNVLRWLQADMK